MKLKFILLAALYISQYIPTTFFIQTVPILMRQQNMALGEIGFLGFLVIPSALKFLWAPLIDRYRPPKLGHYRGWIIIFQSLLVITLVGTAFLHVHTNMTGLFVCMFLAFLFSASQDIATDALAVNLLTPQERGIGNAIQASGNFLGAIIGGGVALILLDRAGFQSTILTLALWLLVGLVPVLFHQEREQPVNRPAPFESYVQPFIRFFSRPGIGLWLCIVLLYMIGENVSTTLTRPLLVDRGFSLSEIGTLLGVYSYVSRIIAALIAGILIKKLGCQRSLIVFGIFANLALLLYVLPVVGVSSLLLLSMICILVSGLQSMAYTALLTAMMARSDSVTAGTDYTTQISVVFVGVVLTTAWGGVVAQAIGYLPTFIVSAAISLLSITLIPEAYKIQFR